MSNAKNASKKRKPAAKVSKLKPAAKCPAGHWPTRAAALKGIATALGTAPNIHTLQKWTLTEGCPVPAGARPIPIAATLEWIRNHKTTPGRVAQVDPEKEVRAQLLRHKLATQTGRTISVADVENDINRASAILRRVMLQELPTQIYMACHGKTVEDAAEEIKAILTDAINNFAEEAQKSAKAAGDKL